MIGLEAHLDELRKRIFPEGKPIVGLDFFILLHGSRIVGYSALLPIEGRGLNSCPELLWIMSISEGVGIGLASSFLRYLADKGLGKASVITREGVPAARYLYPKFGGRGSVIESSTPTAS